MPPPGGVSGSVSAARSARSLAPGDRGDDDARVTIFSGDVSARRTGDAGGVFFSATRLASPKMPKPKPKHKRVVRSPLAARAIARSIPRAAVAIATRASANGVSTRPMSVYFLSARVQKDTVAVLTSHARATPGAHRMGDRNCSRRSNTQ